ncbi:MAG: sodium:solute symporter, partial [bacterium]|nr:sodium:solute symporter [bacterium]
MVSFALLDWIWLALFIVLMVVCGIIFYRLGKRSQSDFFLAGRGLPWWLPASSVYATHTATDTPIWVTGVVYKYGFAGLWYAFFCAWAAISAFVSTRIFRRSLAYSQAEWQSLRFGGLGAEMLRGWVAGWQVFMNMFILGWVGIAMGKLCNLLFGWDLWIGLVVFTSIGAIYVLSSGYWGVVMADFQQGVIAFLVILIVSIWGVIAAGGPKTIIDKLKNFNSTVEWKVPDTISQESYARVRLTDPKTGKQLVQSQPFLINPNFDKNQYQRTEKKLMTLIADKTQADHLVIMFPSQHDTVFSGQSYNIVWTSGKTKKHVNIEHTLNSSED